MTQTYPKSYVLERIAARRTSLERRQKDDTATIAAADKIIGDALAEYLPAVIADIEAALKVARKSKIVGDYAKDQQTIERILRAVKNPGDEGPLAYRYGEAGPARQQVERRNTAVRARKEYAAELDALEHTEAYLRGTPVDEFSLTALSKLGLLDVIKFSLSEAKEQR